MTPAVSQLLAAAARFSLPERAELVDRLAATLAPELGEASPTEGEQTSFPTAAAYVLQKNRELYRRLA